LLYSTIISSNSTFNILQNLQDARANSFRAGRLEDDLQRSTEAFVPADHAFDNQNGDNHNEGECEDNHGKLDELLNLLTTENQATSDESGTSETLPASFSLQTVRQKGVLKCGYEALADMNLQPEFYNPVCCEVQQATAGSNETHNDDNDGNNGNNNGGHQQTPKQREIVHILMSKTSRRSKTFEEITGRSESIEVLEANGSVKSIFDWAEKANLDRRHC